MLYRELRDEVMKKCYECGKELKFWEGYRHPALGKKELVCSNCFDSVEESMEKYRKFLLNEHNDIISEGKLDFFSWWDNFKKAIH